MIKYNMKCTIPEISWHNRNPVLSIHVQPISEKFYRLATGGSDCHVLIWQLIINELGAVKVEALSDLTRHHKAVNSVRWSPSGQHLATADDDANIIVWQLKTDNIPLLEGETNDKETWVVYKVMRGHKEDIYDLCWSPNGLRLFSGSVDNTAILWDFTKGKSEEILTDHKGFVQGVAWDPKGYYLATISTDRVCRIYDSSGKVRSRIQRGYLPVSEDHYLHNKEVKFFHDDTFRSFFRRLDFSPDGTLLAVPSGRIEIEDCKKILNATHIFAVDSWSGPIALLPSGKQCSTVVRFCPILFEKHENGPDPVISLPYRMVVAVGTDHDVILYDTQQVEPFAYFRDINYTRLTDLTWSDDGRLLIASSSDGFCALISFEVDELGVQYVKEESENEESVLDVSGCEELDKEETIESVKRKRLSLLEQWTVKTPKKNVTEVAVASSSTNETSCKRKGEEANKSVCKRIKPIPVEDKKVNNETAPSKRIKPILIEDKKSSGSQQNKDPSVKIQDPPPKVSPLLNFLKRATKKSDDRNKPTVASPIVDLTLDEHEARDSWPCEKDQPKALKPAVIDTDDYTEDFSLHLDDTNSTATNINQNKNNCTETALSSEKDSDVKIETATTNVKLPTAETKSKETENCVQTNKDPINIKQKNTEVAAANTIKSVIPEEKGSIPKRRIPLITLSSPKQKKK